MPDLRMGAADYLTPIKPIGREGKWLCRCVCGNHVELRKDKIGPGQYRSCGCMKSRLVSRSRTRHGMKGSRVYSIWNSMKSRCYSESASKNKHYQARGIAVCDRWHSFENFYADMGDPPTNKHTLDRIDNSGNYTPENCRWATMHEQNQNRSSVRYIEFGGKRQHLSAWSREMGITVQALARRIDYYGWPIERALTEGKRNAT